MKRLLAQRGVNAMEFSTYDNGKVTTQRIERGIDEDGWPVGMTLISPAPDEVLCIVWDTPDAPWNDGDLA